MSALWMGTAAHRLAILACHRSYNSIAGKNLALVLPSNLEVRTGEAIQSLGMGFLPISALASKFGAGYLNPRELEFRVDLLTTCLRGAQGTIRAQAVHVGMQPRKFMEYLLEHVQQPDLAAVDWLPLPMAPRAARKTRR